MSRRDRVRAGAASLALALLIGCGGGSSPTPDPPAEKLPPSILLVSLDTTRADHLGCYGDAAAATPTLDRFAAEGVVFNRAFTTVPATLPAHASLLTGLSPDRHGVRDNGLYRLPDDVPTLAETLSARGYATRAVVASAVLDRQYGLDRGFSVYGDRTGQLAGLAIPERSAAKVTDAAIAQLADLERPFFLFVHYFDPHADYRPPSPFAELFRDRPYDGEIAYVDRELGRLRDAVAARGLLDGTVVAIVSDHGESLGEHGEATHGVFLYQAVVRIPMILVAPDRLPGGRRSDAPVSIVDVAPTLLALAGAPAGDLDGRSLLGAPAAEIGSGGLARVLPLESEFGYNAYGWAPLAGATDGRWKWIEAPRPELYDLDGDPGETRNIVDRQTDQVERLRAARDGLVRESRIAPPPGGASDEERARQEELLVSLGYVSAAGRPSGGGQDLPDPKDRISTLRTINAAREALASGRPAEAARMLESLVAASPSNLSALVLLGSARLGAGDPAGAMEPLLRAAELSPDKADVHYNLGQARMGVGDLDGAERAWRRTLEIAPRMLEAAVNLADLLDGTGRTTDAAAVVDRARGAHLENPLLDYLDGRFALGRGDVARARRLLDRALAGGLPPAVARDARMLRMRAGGG